MTSLEISGEAKLQLVCCNQSQQLTVASFSLKQYCFITLATAQQGKSERCSDAHFVSFLFYYYCNSQPHKNRNYSHLSNKHGAHAYRF